MAIDKQPSCDDPQEPELLPVAVALQRMQQQVKTVSESKHCLLYTSPSPRDLSTSRMPSSA